LEKKIYHERDKRKLEREKIIKKVRKNERTKKEEMNKEKSIKSKELKKEN
jgi:hypothetical protein